MTAIMRNAFLAAVVISAVGGSAMAGSRAIKTECDKTITSDFWNGRCCDAISANCMGGERHDRDRGDNSRGKG